MNFFKLEVDPRDAQYGRLASSVLRTLKLAVGKRIDDGQTQQELADRLGWDKGRLSRILNGRVKNITIKTVSDVLWACEAEPTDFDFDFVEDISPNGVVIATTSTPKTNEDFQPKIDYECLHDSTVTPAAIWTSPTSLARL